MTDHRDPNNTIAHLDALFVDPDPDTAYSTSCAIGKDDAARGTL